MMNDIPDKQSQSDPWQQHRTRQLVLGLKSTPAQRLAWLEEMMVLAAAHRRLGTSATHPNKVG